MQGEFIRIPTEMLDETPGPYTMSFGFDLDPMLESIRKVGLLNPPLVERDGSGKIHIIAGYRRALALKSLKEEEIVCRDLSSSTLDASKRLLLNLYDNLACREFNGPEKGMILERLMGHFSEEDVLSFYMPLLGLPSHRPLLMTYLKLGELEREIRVAFAHERLSYKTVRAFVEMRPASRAAFFKWFAIIMFNFNQQSQFIELTQDISSESGVPVPVFLGEGGLVEILEDRGLNGPQKAKAAIDWLRARKLPNLHDAERKFQGMIRRIGLPDGVVVQHSPFFESQDYRLELRFRDGKALRKKILELASLEGLEQFMDPWKV